MMGKRMGGDDGDKDWYSDEVYVRETEFDR